jgi:hypothetical protein
LFCFSGKILVKFVKSLKIQTFHIQNGENDTQIVLATAIIKKKYICFLICLQASVTNSNIFLAKKSACMYCTMIQTENPQKNITDTNRKYTEKCHCDAKRLQSMVPLSVRYLFYYYCMHLLCSNDISKHMHPVVSRKSSFSPDLDLWF